MLSNVIKLNDEELVTVADLFSIRGGEADLARRLMLKYQLKVVAVTRGAKGAVLYCPEETCHAKGEKINIVDTVGAGDSFTAALVIGLINGVKRGTIVNLANRLASYVCGRHGATPMLSRKMILTMKPLAVARVLTQNTMTPKDGVG